MRDLYDPFIGSWDVESSIAGPGEWHFERLFGGLGVRDVIYPVGAPPEKHGITMRSYDEAEEKWHCFYTSPGDREFVYLVGRRDGDRVEQLGYDLVQKGRVVLWTFSEIGPTSFLWQGRATTDGGETWSLEHEMRCTRRS